MRDFQIELIAATGNLLLSASFLFGMQKWEMFASSALLHCVHAGPQASDLAKETVDMAGWQSLRPDAIERIDDLTNATAEFFSSDYASEIMTAFTHTVKTFRYMSEMSPSEREQFAVRSYFFCWDRAVSSVLWGRCYGFDESPTIPSPLDIARLWNFACGIVDEKSHKHLGTPHEAVQRAIASWRAEQQFRDLERRHEPPLSFQRVLAEI